MVHIIYRHYQKSDDLQLSVLFNRAFQMNGGGFARTPRGLNWRYIQSPNFEPEMIQIAEDLDENKIVGAVYVNLIESVRLNNNDYLTGDINDVTCLPEYTKRGIATNLMHMAMDYMRSKNCDLSILTADFKGFPRKKIYIKFGYKDIDRGYVSFGIVKPRKLVKDLPLFIALSPIFLCYSYFPRLINKIHIKLNRSLRDYTYKIFHNQKHYYYYLDTANMIMPKYYNGYPLYSREKVRWAKIKVPAKRHTPTYIIVYKKNEIIGGASITHKNIYANKYGIKIQVGMIHEIFIDKEKFVSRKELNAAYKYLIDKVILAARQRKVGGIFYNGSIEDHDLNRSLRYFCFLNFNSNAVMIKRLKVNLKPLRNSNPLFVPTYVSLGFP